MSEEGSKENTILNGLRHQKERSAQGHPSGPPDSIPQGPAPTAPTHTSQTGGPPQAPPDNSQKRDHHDPPEHNRTTNGSTRPPADDKGPEIAKGRNKMSEPYPGASSDERSATQPAESFKTLLLYIHYVFKISKHHLTFIKRPGHHLISLKILISNG